MGKVSARTMWTVGAATAGILMAVGAFAGVSAMRSGEAHAAIPSHGNIFQSGTLVGWASGARISASDRSIVEFEQIAHARQLAQQNEFEYGGLKMRISRVLQVDYVQASDSTARPDQTLVRVTARTQPPR